MAIKILTDEQRQRYGCFTGDPSPDDLARYFHLDTGDLEIIQDLRGDQSRLGFALTLCGARFLGLFPDKDTAIPKSVLVRLARQLDLAPDTRLDDYFESRQRIRHLIQIRSRYGFTEFATDGRARFRLTRWLYALCWSGDDRPGGLIERAISWLMANKVLLPGVTTLERLVGRVRDRAQNRLWRWLVNSLDSQQRARIEGLFSGGEGEQPGTSEFSALEALRTVPTKRMSSEFYRHLDRLDAIRAFGLRPIVLKGVPALRKRPRRMMR